MPSNTKENEMVIFALDFKKSNATKVATARARLTSMFTLRYMRIASHVDMKNSPV